MLTENGTGYVVAPSHCACGERVGGLVVGTNADDDALRGCLALLQSKVSQHLVDASTSVASAMRREAELASVERNVSALREATVELIQRCWEVNEDLYFFTSVLEDRKEPQIRPVREGFCLLCNHGLTMMMMVFFSVQRNDDDRRCC